MTTIADYFKYAQLAQASYAPFDDLTKTVQAALTTPGKGDFAPTQADEFLKQYTLLSHQSNDAEGFSASVFKDASGEYTLAIRGTEIDLAGVISPRRAQ